MDIDDDEDISLQDDIISAIEQNNTKKLDILMSDNISEINSQEIDVLLLAMKYGDLSLIQKLIKLDGIFPDEYEYKISNYIHEAVINPELFKLIIEKLSELDDFQYKDEILDEINDIYKNYIYLKVC